MNILEFIFTALEAIQHALMWLITLGQIDNLADTTPACEALESCVF